MSDQNQSSGQSQTPVGNEESTQIKKDAVAYETHMKLLGEKKRQQEELLKTKELLSKFESEKKEIEEKSLREKEDFKKLFEARDAELKTEKEKRLEIEKAINDSRKMNSFLKNVGAPIEEKYWNLIDLDKIAIDPNTGKPDESIVKSYAEEFKKNFWEVVKTKTGTMPNESTSREASGLTYEQWLKLSHAEQKKRLKDVI